MSKNSEHVPERLIQQLHRAYENALAYLLEGGQGSKAMARQSAEKVLWDYVQDFMENRATILGEEKKNMIREIEKMRQKRQKQKENKKNEPEEKLTQTARFVVGLSDGASFVEGPGFQTRAEAEAFIERVRDGVTEYRIAER